METLPRPVIYLNPLEHAGRPFIKFYYKNNSLINEKLKQADWVNYSKQYSCFLTHFTNENLMLIQRLLGDLARIDTRYLLTKPIKAPAPITVISKEQSNVLPAFDEPHA